MLWLTHVRTPKFLAKLFSFELDEPSEDVGVIYSTFLLQPGCKAFLCPGFAYYVYALGTLCWIEPLILFFFFYWSVCEVFGPAGQNHYEPLAG